MEEWYAENAKKAGPKATQEHELSTMHRGLGNTWKSYGNPNRLLDMLQKMDAKFAKGQDVSSDISAYRAAQVEERAAAAKKKTAGRGRNAKKTRKGKKAGRRTRKH